MMFAVKDITGRVLREATVQSMIDDFEKQLHNVVGRSEQLNCDHEWKVDTFDWYGFQIEQYCDKCDKKEAI